MTEHTTNPDTPLDTSPVVAECLRLLLLGLVRDVELIRDALVHIETRCDEAASLVLTHRGLIDPDDGAHWEASFADMGDIVRSIADDLLIITDPASQED